MNDYSSIEDAFAVVEFKKRENIGKKYAGFSPYEPGAPDPVMTDADPLDVFSRWVEDLHPYTEKDPTLEGAVMAYLAIVDKEEDLEE